MDILFLHQNFPGQFRHIAQALLDQPGNRLVALAQPQARSMEGVQTIRYKPKRDAHKATHRYLVSFERAVLVGQEVVRKLVELKQHGFNPRFIIAHPGWGESLYVKDVFPDATLIHFCEFYYHADGADAGFDPASPVSLDDRARIRTRNALHLLNLEQCDIAVAPTHWQQSLHPPLYQPKIRVIHEGVDTQAARPDPDVRFTLPNGRVLSRSDQVITYVARNLEPYRGFPQFIRAMGRLLAERPEVTVLIVGGDDVSYGSKPEGAANWREKMASEVPLNADRVHFLGKLPYADYLKVLQISTVHTYLTYPFVLSWSMLEALACGCVLVGSATAPVQEVLRHEVNGFLVDFFDDAALCRQISVLLDAADLTPIRHAARATVLGNYSQADGTRGWLQLMGLNPAPPTYSIGSGLVAGPAQVA
ncbi:glycosyltransferase family 4 protein [Parachitinimonas caeni]|uniref:Glycosyltransferase family 4 protein n=1 Tax=Parachitinimonas caeni TaxID=3031301 RepID=A0ABT7DTA2_9NEIS|nr:glycosyltransferase family 4 protein [Parachitinimonas caeni]MDK2123277.1 glycosyltransferase family 4 protein [Parachitinimonas caeni]